MSEEAPPWLISYCIADVPAYAPRETIYIRCLGMFFIRLFAPGRPSRLVDHRRRQYPNVPKATNTRRQRWPPIALLSEADELFIGRSNDVVCPT
jgi:hypothetical protein